MRQALKQVGRFSCLLGPEVSAELGQQSGRGGGATSPDSGRGRVTLKVPEQTVSHVTAGPATLRLGAAWGLRRRSGNRGTRLRLQAGYGSGQVSMRLDAVGSSCQQSRAPAQPGPTGPGLSQLLFVTRKLETLSAPGAPGQGGGGVGRYTSARTCPDMESCLSLAQAAAGKDCLSPPLCRPEAGAPSVPSGFSWGWSSQRASRLQLGRAGGGGSQAG